MRSSAGWPPRQQTDTRKCTRKLFNVVEGLRGSFYDLLKATPAFLGDVLAFRLRIASTEDSAHFWRALGADSAAAEDLSCVDLCWEDGKLWVADECEGLEDIFDLIFSGLAYVFRFRTSCDSRFLSVGSSMLSIVDSHMVGLAGLVQHVRSRTSSSEHCIREVDRFDAETDVRCKCKFGVLASQQFAGRALG